ncbi:hypothetical protein Pst134EA_032456 [Puccinia striiformis f. sp. tritici]|uniref:uncharacterized protein n=1 Tax=Puccinia striiformis f. sp. tritici TaxID=168172 RepID=UPI0020075794|nr:uncharacterized protein Pst134EA_032352 [Puccinia striiformis f. sp. tritici]XP_047796847.1 uncharacterized protein Pst134EA_032456 [Puccinia striiformis f. sp. tritici]KAH9440654.1 hypothetical protein Pst134EA_032352 [Puccinia striiformis f. sp. tritici]KAH9444228.1 hypothetical protein Pst134EA_032456 [Puccinia striiformis f. sp. tritici]
MMSAAIRGVYLVRGDPNHLASSPPPSLRRYFSCTDSCSSLTVNDLNYKRHIDSSQTHRPPIQSLHPIIFRCLQALKSSRRARPFISPVYNK